LSIVEGDPLPELEETLVVRIVTPRVNRILVSFLAALAWLNLLMRAFLDGGAVSSPQLPGSPC
jgi:hypothetical protein